MYLCLLINVLLSVYPLVCLSIPLCLPIHLIVSLFIYLYICISKVFSISPYFFSVSLRCYKLVKSPGKPLLPLLFSLRILLPRQVIWTTCVAELLGERRWEISWTWLGTVKGLVWPIISLGISVPPTAILLSFIHPWLWSPRVGMQVNYVAVLWGGKGETVVINELE